MRNNEHDRRNHLGRKRHWRPRSLGRDALAAIGSERERKQIVINERGDYVWIQELTAQELDWYQQQQYTLRKGRVQKPDDPIKVKLLVLGLINEDGSKMFRRNEWESLTGWRSSLQELLFREICDLCGISDDPEDNFLPGSKKTK